MPPPPPLNRRRFLLGLGLSTSAAAAASPTMSEGEALSQRAADLRASWARQRESYCAGMNTSAAFAALEAPLHDIGQGLGALSTVKELERFSLEEQVHPALQALLWDAAAHIGGAILASRALLQAYLDQHDTLDGESRLREGLRGVRRSLGDWQTTVGRQKKLDQALQDLLADELPGNLLRRMRHTLRKIVRLETLAGRVDASWQETGVLEDSRPHRVAQVRAAQARWARQGLGQGGLAPATAMASSAPGLKIVLGLLVMGLGITAGVLIAAAGLCTIACGDSFGVIVLLAGIAVGALAIWGGATLVRAGRQELRKNLSAAPDLPVPEPETVPEPGPEPGPRPAPVPGPRPYP